MKWAFGKWFNNLNWIATLFVAIALLLTVRNFVLDNDAFDSNYTHYNNFVIFKNSFFHLIHGQDLYQSYPEEQFDLFKYSPTFALFFGLVAWMPAWLGLSIWNILNVGVLFLAIRNLPAITKRAKIAFGLLVLQELVTTTMNSQSNALIAGLLILGWIALENGNGKKAALYFLCTAFIKIFGILFFILFLFYPKWYKYIVPSIGIFLLFFLLPLPILGIQNFKQQYISYGHLLAGDNASFVKYSVMGWLYSWFHFSPPKNVVIVVGLLLQLLPLKLLRNQTTTKTKALYTSSLLIWLVVFNHMAESATFIIAVAGVFIWLFYSNLPKAWRIGFLIPVIAFTCFGPSDIYPKEMRHLIVEELQLKVFPCILIWCICLGELLLSSKPKELTH